VDSRVVVLAPRSPAQAPAGSGREFTAFVSAFFQRRRKRFSGTLKILAERAGRDGPEEKELFAFLTGGGNLTPDARPEDVPPDVYRDLFRLFRGEKIFLTKGK
jgi:16S rRNA A1518/A1519 N6-dimethyltransferase RsmA/KsgA/DIM1 with predicted DNA glycosylase/AP lyase activity